MDSRARSDLDLHDALRSERSVLDGIWQDVALRIWPDYAVFHQPLKQMEGAQRTFELLDSTGAVALDRYGSALMKLTAPSHQIYQGLTISNEELGEDPAVKNWLDFATKVVFRRRYTKQSNFAAQYLECCKASGAFGPMATYIDEIIDPHHGRSTTRYTSLHLSTTYFTEDAYNRTNGMVRRLEYTAAQMAEKWGEAVLPEKIRKALQSPNQSARLQKWEVIHVVQPKDLIDGLSAFSFTSRYSCREGACMLSDGGVSTLPIAAARWSTMPGEKYGRSPAMLVLPSLKMMNEIKRTYLTAANRAANPPLLAYDDGIISIIRNLPGKVTPGGLDEQGREMVKQMSNNARVEWAKEALDDERRTINDVFLITLFQILSEQPRVQTATEVVQRDNEKATLLAPAIERIQSEYFGPLTDRDLELAMASGELPPMPDILLENRHAIRITYKGDMARAQQADDVMSILRVAEASPAFTANDPGAAKAIRWAEAFAKFAEGSGMSPKLILTKDELDAEQAQVQQQQQLAMLAQGAPAAGAAAKDFAQAEATRNTQAAARGVLV